MIFDATMLNIGRAKQIFVDDLIIESVENVCRAWHQPVKLDTPVIYNDRPWEHYLDTNCNDSHVEIDPQDRLFKCWYCDWDKPDLSPEDTSMGKSTFNILYAESEDGIHWRKPAFDIYHFQGQKTNVVMPDAYNLGMVIDPHEQDASRRFKAIYTEFKPDFGDVATIALAVSPDGIHWQRLKERPVIGRSGSHLDDVMVVHYDPAGRIFVMNTRHYDMYAVARNLQNPVVGNFTPPYYPLDWTRMNKRRVWQTESADLIHWSEPYAVITPQDGADDLDETYYDMCQYPVGSVTMGFLNTFHHTANTMAVRLVYSRDGKTWHYLNKGQPFLRPGGEGRWDAYLVTMVSRSPLEVGDELYFYHSGAINHHDWWICGAREGLPVPEATDMSKVAFGLGLARLRLDGFCSLDAGPARRGIFVTRPVISDGKQLVVNARCLPGGSISAEIVNVKDEVFPGYSRQECDVFTGDAVKHVFSWKGKTELPAAAKDRAEYPKAEFERFRKIRFYMEKAEVYALTLA